VGNRRFGSGGFGRARRRSEDFVFATAVPVATAAGVRAAPNQALKPSTDTLCGVCEEKLVDHAAREQQKLRDASSVSALTMWNVTAKVFSSTTIFNSF
jgi:hypothetical protein